MEFIKFIFSSFWVFIGFIIILDLIFDFIKFIIKNKKNVFRTIQTEKSRKRVWCIRF